jgi:arylsulfate sulfotransferase
VVWILGSHRGWGAAGNGVALAPLLLNPLDRAGQPISDPAVRDGTATHPDFEWNWYQHAPLVMPNGHVMLFDNGGNNRNYSGSGQYSRAVEYEINTTAKTVRQVWSYGKARGVTTFSNIVSDVDFLAASNHVLWVPGAVNSGSRYGKIVELDYATQSVVFEATLTPPQTFFGITMHRAERLSLYP